MIELVLFLTSKYFDASNFGCKVSYNGAMYIPSEI